MEHVGEATARLKRHLTKGEQPRSFQEAPCFVSVSA